LTKGEKRKVTRSPTAQRVVSGRQFKKRRKKRVNLERRKATQRRAEPGMHKVRAARGERLTWKKWNPIETGVVGNQSYLVLLYLAVGGVGENNILRGHGRGAKTNHIFKDIQ